MKKLLPFALYALVTPAVMLTSSAVLAQQPAGQDADREQQSTQRDQDATRSTTRSSQSGQSTQRDSQSGDQAATDRQNMRDRAGMQHRDYLDSVPASGMHASNLIGAEVKTGNDEDVGSVDDLIIDEDGQVVAIVVGVGGFLGMGEKDVAIGWGHVTMSGDSDDQELQVDVTREDLQSAPEFETEED